MIADLGMDIALAKGTPTHCHNVTKKWSRLDQVFTIEHTLDAIIICDTIPGERGVNTDHIPIVMVIDVELTKAPTQIARNYRDVDWEKFHKLLKEKLSTMGLPRHIGSPFSLN